jgi:hypothetical protein
MFTAARVLRCLGFPAQAVQRSQESLAPAQALEQPLSLAVAQQYAATLHYRRREVSAVQAQADALLTLATVQGLPLQVEYGIFLRGYALAMQGQGEALPLYEAGEGGDALTEAYRLQGALLLQQANPDASQAEACFQQALVIVRRQQAKSWELRAATSFARLWQYQGKRDAARELLAPIYGWFTEGFDTADLQDAKALLEELA